jgi:hypothetical protein
MWVKTSRTSAPVQHCLPALELPAPESEIESHALFLRIAAGETEWVADGMPLEKVQGLLGYRDIATTQKYVHYVAEHAKDAAQQAEERQLARRKQATNRQQEKVTFDPKDGKWLCRKEDSNLHPLARTRT